MKTLNTLKIHQEIKSEIEWATPQSLKTMRKYQYRMTQKEFSALLGVKLGTYIGWEFGRHKPSSSGQTLLHIAKYHSDVFMNNRQEIISKLAFQE